MTVPFYNFNFNKTYNPKVLPNELCFLEHFLLIFVFKVLHHLLIFKKKEKIDYVVISQFSMKRVRCPEFKKILKNQKKVNSKTAVKLFAEK